MVALGLEAIRVYYVLIESERLEQEFKHLLLMLLFLRGNRVLFGNFLLLDATDALKITNRAVYKSFLHVLELVLPRFVLNETGKRVEEVSRLSIKACFL